MPSSEARHSRKALAGLLGFVARGEATGPLASARSGRITLERRDGSRREVDAKLLKAALSRGLLADKVSQGENADDGAEATGQGAQANPGLCSYAPTPEGRAALKRWLSDPDSAFQDQHRTLVLRSDPDHGLMSVNADESPLAALARIRARDGTLFLEPSHVEAGERLRADFTRGQMQPSLGQRWEPVRLGRQPGAPGGAAEMSEAALSARLRIERALDDVGPELAGVLLDVCCFLKGLAQVERERQWPARSAKLMLRTALSALARHYGAPRRTAGRTKP
ncbi:DUF6456 domain-containing protein [Hoeflea sp.]|uniref:DUF6456 domain-containing protein n=1 Tax=Hoeflea sp. TaxID=1940281 RepID=UPI0019CAB92D|nr:DUF6456 domain-containing protein [Hoeflea sp.]MBC7281137.1 hypothetical protein [Hoeflea sp.]